MRIGPVLNLSLLRCISQNPGISYDDLRELNKDMEKVLFDIDLKELVAALEVKEENGHYWKR